MGLFSGPGVTPSLKGQPTNVIELNSGSTWLIPAGWQSIKPGRYTSLQQYDPISTIWRTIGAGSTAAPQEYFYSDGQNYRLANQTGCAVGAVVTTAGSGYLPATPPTVVASAGGSVWKVIVGGAISTTVTVSNGGTNYTYPPIVLISAPPSPGVQATAYATLTTGAVSSVTVIDQGAGYNTPPVVTFVNDPREGLNGVAQGYNAAAVTTLTGAGTVTALLCLDHGTGGLTAVPTFTWSSGSAAATAVMCWSITAYTVSATTTGSGYATPVIVTGYATLISGSVILNPTIQSSLVKGREARIVGAVSAGAMTATGQTVLDGGVYASAPTMFAYPGPAGTAGSFATFLAPTMGGQTDISYITPV